MHYLIPILFSLQAFLIADTTNEFPFIEPVSVETLASTSALALLDDDNDGVDDSVDKCLDTLPNTEVDILGCKLLVNDDNDKDGIANADDKCPNSQANALVDSNGCAPDNDHDGVTNYKDECPYTSPEFIVDNKGCPQSTLLGVKFKNNTYTILPQSLNKVLVFAEFLQDNTSYQAIIYGHTNDSGDASADIDLSRNRAKAIMNVLIKEGIKLTRLTAIGMGAKNPIANKNQRIEVELLR